MPQLVLEAQDLKDVGCAKAPSELCEILEDSPDKKHMIISAFDPLKGRGKVLRTIEAGVEWTSLSPDGSILALGKSGESEIHLLSLSGGRDRIVRPLVSQGINYCTWSGDGKWLYCGTFSKQGGGLAHVDLEGKASILWQQPGARAVFGVPSPNGRYVAISSRSERTNVWMLEGF